MPVCDHSADCVISVIRNDTVAIVVVDVLDSMNVAVFLLFRVNMVKLLTCLGHCKKIHPASC